MSGYMNKEQCKPFIEEVEVKTFRQTMRRTIEGCPGKMHYTGSEKTSNPPWYGHRCEVCGNCADLRNTYPRNVHREVRDETK